MSTLAAASAVTKIKKEIAKCKQPTCPKSKLTKLQGQLRNAVKKEAASAGRRKGKQKTTLAKVNAKTKKDIVTANKLAKKIIVKKLLKQLDEKKMANKLKNCIAKDPDDLDALVTCYDKITKEEKDIREKISKLLLTFGDVVLKAQFVEKTKKIKAMLDEKRKQLQNKVKRAKGQSDITRLSVGKEKTIAKNAKRLSNSKSNLDKKIKAAAEKKKLLESIESMAVNELVQKGNKLIEESIQLKQSSMGNPGKYKDSLKDKMFLMLKIDARLTKLKKKRKGIKMRQQAALISNFLKNALKLKF